ncbi:MAG: radical SAM protein [Krumholzibacteria bacterium]|nr:radical SAM protein [Candidatus Krumholzibacteria bacterium]
MDHIGRIFRPPSEAQSLLLQVTVGCSHNRCTYCAMYDDPAQSRFRAKPWPAVAADIAEAGRLAAGGLPIRRVFLTDGDALILPTAQLERILAALHEALPQLRRVGIYGDARSILRKSPADLARLRDLGLGIVYHGAESGDDEVLRRVNKGSTAAEAVAAAGRLREAGLRHSVMVMLGLGGTERSAAHAAATAELLTAMDPPFVGALTTTLVPGTPLHATAAAGGFDLPDPWGMLAELRTIVAGAGLTRCRFHSNHASNYVPLSLNLPADRERGLALLDAVLARRRQDDLKPEFLRGL